MFNNEFQVKAVVRTEEGATQTIEPSPRVAIRSELCLTLRLPTTSTVSRSNKTWACESHAPSVEGVLRREAEQHAPYEELRQLRRTPTPPTPTPDESPEDSGEPEPRPRRTSLRSAASSLKEIRRRFSNSSPNGPWREPLGHEVFRAVEQKDLMFLMEVRDRAFHLLLRKTGDATPLVHVMRIGDSHRDVAIVLLGAFSRWVNTLDDEEIQTSQTRLLLKALRTNLKLAIDYGLQQSQSDLLASFLQTLIMSEGDKWVNNACSTVSLALRAGTEGKPTTTAESIVRAFATKELGKAESIASLEEYVYNATSDLILMGIWSIALDRISGEPIPSYCFARDARVFHTFEERIRLSGNQIAKLSRRLKWQIRVASKVFQGRASSYKRKIELISQEFDNGPGV